VRFAPQLIPPGSADAWLGRLVADLPWRQQSVRLFGRWIPEPRLTSWHGDPGASYRYSGRTNEPSPWLPVLQELRQEVEQAVGARFNSVLANRYRSGFDHMGWHSDDEPELGPEPLIASLSFGAPRRLQFRPRPKGPIALSLDLPPGSLLVMGGQTQRRYQHRVAKTAVAVPERINLTFRWVQPTSVGP
jgi:alkylated DNA repair dioxygenase AlkB